MAEALIPENLKAYLSTLRTTMGRGLLSAMVGAGFSFNAEKLDPSAEHVSWEKLGEKIEKALWELQEVPAPPKELKIFDPEDVLATAKKYKELANATPGAKPLDELIYESSSYEDFRPGLLHQKLLSLHWSDIFTTNYDCLFERTQETDQGCEFPIIRRPYNIIRQGRDLPHSKPAGTRRIIKLHGSFPLPGILPSVRPYLLAKDDYKNYKNNNGLFVQEVQHSLVNETFCLIGFSGTDPNFKSWVTWVEKELEGNQPKLYFIGFGKPTIEEQAYFDAHNIVAVNIAHLAGVIRCSSHDERQTALHAFFSHLKVEYPEEPLWSYKNTLLPKSHPGRLNSIVEYCEASSVLRRKRESYPGWVFPPLEIVNNAVQYFDLHAIPNWPQLLLNGYYASDPVAKWIISYEYLWAYDTFCIPLFEMLEHNGLDALLQLLNDVWDIQYSDDLKDRLACLPDSIQVDVAEFTATLQNAACIFQRFFRRHGIHENVSYFRKKLDESLVIRPNVEAEHWSIYNDIICCLESCNPKNAESLIASWNVDRGELYWKTRKANLLAELEKTVESQRLLLDSLFEIRAEMRSNGESAYLLSCEAWTERFLEVVNQYIAADKPIVLPSEPDDTESGNEDDNDMLSRTPVLRRLAFHPFQILNGLGERLRILATLRTMGDPQLDYFTGVETPNRTAKSGLATGFHEPHIFMGILEKTGLPSRIGNPSRGGRLGNSMWINAVTVLFRFYRFHHHFIFQLVHRMLDSNIFAKEQVIFTRYSLASMTEDCAQKAFDTAFPLLARFHEDYRINTKEQWRYSRYLRFLLQYVGRLCPLLDQDRVEKTLSSLQNWYTQGALFSKDTVDVFLETLVIAVKATSTVNLKKKLDSLLSLPLVPTNTKLLLELKIYSPINWPEIFSGRDLRREDADWDAIALTFLQDIQREESWLSKLPATPSIPPANAVSKEIADEFEKFRWANIRNEARDRKISFLSPYWSVLVWMQESNFLTQRSLHLISQHLWLSYTGIAPEIVGYQQLVAPLVFPDTDQAQCFNTYRERLFSTVNRQVKQNSEYWYDALGVCLEVSKRFPLSDNELGLLLNELYPEEIPEAPEESLFGRHADQALSYIKVLLQSWGQKGLLRSNIMRERLHAWLELLKEHNAKYEYSPAILDILLLELNPANSHAVADELRTRLFTGPMRKETGNAVLYWKYCFSSVVPLPEEFVDMVADCFKNIKSEEAIELLSVLCSQVDGYGASLSDSETSKILDGLERMMPVLSYKIPYHERFPGDHPSPRPLPLKIPYHREQVARFLKALLRRKPVLYQHSVIKDWHENLCKDPLADIRNILLI